MATTAVKNTESKSVAAANVGGVPAGLADEMEGMEGLGTSHSAEDNILPFIVLLQALSPEVNKRKPEYVEGAEPGMLLNKATGEIYTDGDLVVQPCHFSKAVVEWVPRDAGGGFVARHESDPEDTKIVPDPRDTSGRKTKKIRAGSKNDLIDTRYQIVNTLDERGTPSPGLLAFASTGHTSHRSWMTLMRQAVVNGKITPSWFKKYRVHVVEKTNTSGSWFVLKFVVAGDEGNPDGWIVDKGLRDAGRSLYESFVAGEKTIGSEDGGTAASDDGADIPI